MIKYFKAVGAAIRDPNALASAFVAFMFFVIAGPFGTYDSLSILRRALFFVPIFALALPVAGVVCHWAHATFSHLRMPFQRMIAMLLFVTVFTPVLHWYKVWFSGEGSYFISSMGSTLFMLSGVAFSIVAVLCLIDIEKARRLTMSDPALAPKPLPRLAKRIPDIGQAEISRITVADHYVQVFLSDGRQMRLLMRFADAVAEMDDTAGHITHRSHWVAEAFVDGMLRDGGRDFVKLRCGTQVPVSRANRSDILRAGIRELA